MPNRTKREIHEQDVQGLKCLRKIRPLLSRLRTVGTKRDTAGNRRLVMDQYCALILMALFSPAIQSLRDLQRASTLDKVRKRLGVTRASLGSLSESVAIVDPKPLKEIAAELGHTISSRPTGRFAAVGQQITAVDGTVIETVKRVAELIAEMDRLRWLIEMFCKTFKQLLGCRHLFSDNHNGVEIQASCGMIVCMLILIDTGEKPNRAMYQMVWSSLLGLASLNELEAFITRRR